MSGRTWTADEVTALGVHTDLLTAGEILGLCKKDAYRLRREGRFPVPVITVGTRRYMVPVAPILELLGITPTPAKEPVVVAYDGDGNPVLVRAGDLMPIITAEMFNQTGPRDPDSWIAGYLQAHADLVGRSGQEVGEER